MKIFMQILFLAEKKVNPTLKFSDLNRMIV